MSRFRHPYFLLDYMDSSKQQNSELFVKIVQINCVFKKATRLKYVCGLISFHRTHIICQAEVAYDFQLAQGFNLIPYNQSLIFQHLKNLGIIQW